MAKNNGNNVNEFDAEFPFAELLTSAEVELLKRNSNVIKYLKGDVIFRQNTIISHVLYLKSGLVKVHKEAMMNKVLILKVVTTKNYIGLLSAFGDELYQYSATAIENCEIIHIDIKVFKEIVRRNGVFALSLMKLISGSGLYIFERLMTQYQKQLPGRIADVILYFANSIYKNNIFHFPLTRRELAELAGTTKESFIRTLTEFKNDRIINLEGRRVEIVSMEILQTLSRLG